MSAERWDVVVVGAGYGGATAAAVLARRGLRVALVEKNRVAGGKALTVARGDLRYEMWPVAGGPARGSRMHELAGIVGLDERALLAPDAVCEFVYLGAGARRRSFVLPARPVRDPRAIAELLSGLGVGPFRLGGLALMSLAIRALPERALDRLDDVSALSFFRAFRLPRALESTLAALLNVLFVVPVDRLPASEAVRTLRQLDRGGAGRYHAGGYGVLAERAARYVEERGGRYLPRTRVERILVDGGRAAGVRTARGELRARLVVSSAGIQPTVFGLAGAERFPAEYVERVRRLEPSWALVGVRYRLRAPVFRHPMTIVFGDDGWCDVARFERARRGDWPRDPLLFVTVPALWDPSLSGDGARQVALASTLAPPGVDDPMQDEAIRRAEASLARLWPDLPGAIVGREAFGTRQVSRLTRDAVLPGMGGECIGIGQLIGQCGRSKPSPETPLPGLWLVGTDAGGFGCGTHQAVESGFRVAEQIEARLRAEAHR